jgi:TIR domain
MADIFISFAQVDRPLAAELVAMLEAKGWRVWWDSETFNNLKDIFARTQVSELFRARVVIVIWTPASIQSDWVREEANLAHLDRKLIPVKLSHLGNSEIPPPFNELQTESVDDHEGILRALIAQLGKPPADRQFPSVGPSAPARPEEPAERGEAPAATAEGVVDGQGQINKIFICYRRDDSASSAGRVKDRLEQEFGPDLVFMDVDAIPFGVDFVKVLRAEVAKCDVLITVIGPSWLIIRDEKGNPRLDDANDFVRIEIAAALQRGIPVIPLLVDGAKVPKANQLPSDIERLAFRHGLEVRHSSFRSDMDRLIRGLKGGTG